MLGFHSISSAPVSALRSLATGAATGSPVYAQSIQPAGRDKRNVAKYGSASWVDLSGAAVVSDAPIYAQSLARRITRATTGNVWVNPDTTLAASSDLSPYAQGNPSLTKRRINSAIWVDFDTAIAVSSDLSPYAQGSARPRPVAATSRYWVDLEPAATASSDLSPYAQTIVSRGTRRNTGTTWISGDDFFPPQADLSAYGQSRYSQSRLVYRPKYQGNVWVDLVDATPTIVPVVPPPSGGGVPSSGRVLRDFGKYPQTTAETHQERVALGIIRKVASRVEIRDADSETEQLAALEAEFELLNLQFQTAYWILLQQEIIAHRDIEAQQNEDELQQVFMLTLLTI